MTNFIKSVISNSESPKETIIEVGTNATLICYYDDPSENKCIFHLYRLDGKLIDNKKEIVYKGATLGGIYNSYEKLSPKFSWFDKEDEEIRIAFDVSFSGNRIPCKDQILVIKKGEVEINLFWGETKNISANQEIKVYAEYSENAQVNSSIAEGGSIYFPIYIEKPKDAKHKGLEEIGFAGKGTQRGYYTGDADYATWSETFDDSSEDYITVGSRTIRFKQFYEHFCKFTLKATIEGGHHTWKDDVKDLGETKNFKRHWFYPPKAVLQFYIDANILPKPISDGKNIIEKILEAKDIVDTIKGLVGLAEDIIKRRWATILGGYVGDKVSEKILNPILNDIYTNYEEANFKYRYFKAEIDKALTTYNETESKSERRRMFRLWFEKHNGGQTPFNRVYLEKREKALIEYLILQNPNEINRNERLRDLYTFKINPMANMVLRWKRDYETFLAQEKATIQFLEKAFTESLTY